LLKIFEDAASPESLRLSREVRFGNSGTLDLRRRILKRGSFKHTIIDCHLGKFIRGLYSSFKISHYYIRNDNLSVFWEGEEKAKPSLLPICHTGSDVISSIARNLKPSPYMSHRQRCHFEHHEKSKTFSLYVTQAAMSFRASREI
jgi:hypothetical protein